MTKPFFSRYAFHLIVILTIFLGAPAMLSAGPDSQKWFLDLSKVDLNQQRVALTGDWQYFENQLLSPSDISAGKGTTAYFPKTWNEQKGDGSGFATYAISVLTAREEEFLAIEIPQLYSSYSLWVNNKLVATNGIVGKSEKETTPQWMPQTVSFENPGDTLRIVLQIANYHHFIGGAKDPIYIGGSDLLQNNRSMAVSGNLVESATLALIAIAFTLIYLFSIERKRVVVFFALLCVTWSIRVGFSNLYVFISYMPDFNWYAMIRIEYFTLFLTMIWAILFLCRVFPKEENKIIKYLLVGSNCLFIAFTALAPPIMFTQWISVYLSFCAVLLGYGAIIVLRAWINQRTGSTYLTISILLGIVVFGYDVFAYEGLFVYNPIIFSVGYITIFSLMSVVLLLHLNIIKSRSKSISSLTYKDLYRE